MKKLLIYGYGNIGRMDDGLAHFFVQELENWKQNEKLDFLYFEENYQLNIEDAELISNYDTVLFVDASLAVDEGFKIEEVDASNSKIEFSMHAVSPSFVLDLCQKMFSCSPKTYVLHLKGHEWGVGEGISNQAKRDMEIAIKELKLGLNKGQIFSSPKLI